MNPVLIIARLTLREASRRRIVTAALLLGALFLVLYAIGFYMILNNSEPIDNTSIREIVLAESHSALFLAGLYAIDFLTIAMAALLAADSLAGEINSGDDEHIIPVFYFVF